MPVNTSNKSICNFHLSMTGNTIVISPHLLMTLHTFLHCYLNRLGRRPGTFANVTMATIAFDFSQNYMHSM